MWKPVITTVTYPSRESAEKASHGLVERRLAVCSQISEITSIYPWEGKVAQETEYKLAIKTFASLLPKLEDYIALGHPYDIPEIISVEVHSVSKPYLEWMKSTLEADQQ